MPVLVALADPNYSAGAPFPQWHWHAHVGRRADPVMRCAVIPFPGAAPTPPQGWDRAYPG